MPHYLTLISLVKPAIAIVKEHWEAVQQVHQTGHDVPTRLDHLGLSLNLVETELSNLTATGGPIGLVGNRAIEKVLTITSEAITQLQAILGWERGLAQHNNISFSAALRDRQIHHLVFRIKTCSLSLCMMIKLRQLHLLKSSTSLAVTVGDGIRLLESTNSDLSKLDKSNARDLTEFTLRERVKILELTEGSEELIQIAAGIVKYSTSLSSGISVTEPTVGSTFQNTRVWLQQTAQGLRDQAHIGTSPLTSTSPPESTTYTPASSVTEDGDQMEDKNFDIDTHIIKQRHKHAVELCQKGRLKQAIPYLKKTLESFTQTTNHAASSKKRLQREILLLLIDAYLQLRSVPLDITHHLKQAMDLSDSHELHEVIHLRAVADFKINPAAPEIAKETCHKAIKARSAQFGRKHELTIKSMQLMTDICVQARDPDADIWALEQGVSKHLHPEDAVASTFLWFLAWFPTSALIHLYFRGTCGVEWALIFYGIPWLGVLSLRRNWHAVQAWDENYKGIILGVCLFVGTWLGLLMSFGTFRALCMPLVVRTLMYLIVLASLIRVAFPELEAF
ncbi:hypothetical protein BT63DRAFT_451586 [Microthyrium microscopicum]|uniref:Uncharacterized protein n=1 Tax=Microthyrium microscopicum TaxID=703497 RepID=A0A6A6UR45_9PEZI|nr:hypothetical protein BT63DRAFT_451586 [Microthyrium microscopicum]